MTIYYFAVDADIRKRYDRIRLRKSSTDNIDFETFVDNEKREMTTTDPTKQNLSECIKKADFVFTNNKEIIDLQRDVENVLRSQKNHQN